MESRNDMDWGQRPGRNRQSRRGPGGHGEGRGRRGGPDGPRGMAGMGGMGGRRRRGDIRPLLLAGLIEGPAYGYELMKRLEEKAEGRWRPSPGSVYPMLQQLEDEGLISSTEDGGRKTFVLTESGTAEADASALDRLAEGRGGAGNQLRTELAQLHLAVKQVGLTDNDELTDQAVAAVKTARQAIYRLLADA
ncbi:PadR family transcriptional regulator [Nocardioides sp. Kera G14]|uniref:PadR family transcriptional regulator n=1 Tax=Nocardioides sp. Kera G14 TaxID=2884264 RepID=UPI001D11A53E|nr:PadR family transcriptional regulator [Nocardioides sp. Kera G14]UDY23289.1 PadR family transcriptional regulator [Nocardioides sp. Kera G14]